MKPTSISRPRQGGFTFKQFFVAHDRCGMKVSTDGILLGAWAPVPTQGDLLDIGTGSGLLALMLAQRTTTSQAQFIDAIEIDCEAVQQAQANIGHSPWAERIRLWQDDFLSWDPPANRQYRLVICNPPYYQQGAGLRDAARARARDSAGLNHQLLLDRVAAIMHPQGKFCVVLPMIEGERLQSLALASGWAVEVCCQIAERADKPAHRVLFSFSLKPVTCSQQQLVIRDEQGEYSEAFKQLTADFYLAF